MRIFYCSITYPPDVNGQAIFTHNLVKGMAASGHEVMVLTPTASEGNNFIEIPGVKVTRIRSIHLTRVHQDLCIPIYSSSFIRSLFDQFQPELIHVQDPSPINLAVIREAHRRKIPVIISHHPGPEITAPYIHVRNSLLRTVLHWIVWKFLLTYLNTGDLVVVPSRYSAKMLTDHHVQTKIKVVGCGVQLENFHPNPTINSCAIRQQYNLDINKTMFLYVGRIDYEKNLDTLIHAMAVSDRGDIQLAIAGQGKEITQLQRLVEELDLHQQVVFIGSINHNKIPDLLNCSNVFVMPGCSESFSIATLEAMASAKPVLAAKSAALPELVVHQINGYLFQPDKPDDAAVYIQLLADQPEVRERMGESSLARAQRNSISDMVGSYEQVYQSCCLMNDGRISVKDRKLKTKTNLEKRVNKAKLILSHRIIIALVIIFSIFFSPFAYDQTQARSNLKVSDLAQLNVISTQRLIVIAPHPDDEILAAGGVIQRVLENGGQVKIVFITNGDGQFLSPLFIDPITVPNDIDYINFGIIRQNETQAALGQIGVTQDEIIFLGYPDGKIHELWAMDWSCDIPVRASYTHASASPYQNTYNIQATYCGSDLFYDLLSIFSDFQPDLILIPNPEDTHSDHVSVSNFTQLAIATYQGSVDQVNPKVLSYLIHYKGYPLPRGNFPDKFLLPPMALSSDGEGWLTHSLSDNERDQKKKALEKYYSQLLSSSAYLRSFIRANEIFNELPNIELPVASYESEETIENTIPPDYALNEPSHNRASRLFFSSADIVNWQVVRLGKLICFGAETRGTISKYLSYRILAQLPDGNRFNISQREDMIWLTEHRFGTCFNLEELGNPTAIGFSAEARSGNILIDQTAWHFVYFPSY